MARLSVTCANNLSAPFQLAARATLGISGPDGKLTSLSTSSFPPHQKRTAPDAKKINRIDRTTGWLNVDWTGLLSKVHQLDQSLRTREAVRVAT